MLKLELFTGDKTYMFPNGTVATPQDIRNQFPAVDTFPHVIEANGDVCQAVMNLSALRAIHNIDENLSDNDAILGVETIMNTPPSNEPSADERMAAAMEFQNLMMMDDEEV